MIFRVFFSIVLALSFLSINAQSSILLKTGETIECINVYLKNGEVNYQQEVDGVTEELQTIDPENVLKIEMEDGSVILLGDETINADKYEISEAPSPNDPGVPDPSLYPLDSKINFTRGFIYNKYYVNNERVKQEKFTFELSKSGKNYDKFMTGRRIDNIGKTLTDISVISGVIYFSTSGLRTNSNFNSSFKSNWSKFILAQLGIGISASITGNQIMKKFIRSYNNIEIPSLGFEGTKNGIGLVLRF